MSPRQESHLTADRSNLSKTTPTDALPLKYIGPHLRLNLGFKSSKEQVKELIQTFRDKGYQHGASYLENLSERLFTHIEIWLKTGVIAPKTTSLLERVFRELGRRLKKIAFGWSDKTVTNLSKMILLKQYSRKKWEEYWKQKLGIKGYFNVYIRSIELSPCINF